MEPGTHRRYRVGLANEASGPAQGKDFSRFLLSFIFSRRYIQLHSENKQIQTWFRDELHLGVIWTMQEADSTNKWQSISFKSLPLSLSLHLCLCLSPSISASVSLPPSLPLPLVAIMRSDCHVDSYQTFRQIHHVSMYVLKSLHWLKSISASTSNSFRYNTPSLTTFRNSSLVQPPYLPNHRLHIFLSPIAPSPSPLTSSSPTDP